VDQAQIDEYFRVLDLTSNSSFEEVREAYKDLVSVWHPDRFANHPRRSAKAAEKLKEINEAYERLKLFFDEKDYIEKFDEKIIIWKAQDTSTIRTHDDRSQRVVYSTPRKLDR
jgi:curved DNA-binding protein CbpA